MSTRRTLLLLTLVGVAGDAPANPVEIRTRVESHALAGILADDRDTGLRLDALVMLRLPGWRDGGLIPGWSVGLGLRAGSWIGVPADATPTTLQPYDRPYNGYTFGGLTLELSADRDRLTAEYTIGGTGSWSASRAVYNTFDDARGFAHVTDAETNQNLWLTWERAFELLPADGDGHLVDLRLTARLALGEVRIAHGLAATLRWGWLRSPRPGAPRDSGAEAWVYATLGLDVVLFDTLIDGPVFDPDPYLVTSRPFVPWGEIGVVVRPAPWLDLRFALRQRGPEMNVPAGSPVAAPHGPVTGLAELGLSF